MYLFQFQTKRNKEENSAVVFHSSLHLRKYNAVLFGGFKTECFNKLMWMKCQAAKGNNQTRRSVARK